MRRGKHRAESGVAPRRGADDRRGTGHLLLNKDMSAVDVCLVLRPLQKKITEHFIEFIAVLLLNSVKKSNLYVQTNEVIGVSFRYVRMSSLLEKKNRRGSSLNLGCDFSGESDVLSMHPLVLRPRE